MKDRLDKKTIERLQALKTKKLVSGQLIHKKDEKVRDSTIQE